MLTGRGRHRNNPGASPLPESLVLGGTLPCLSPHLMQEDPRRSSMFLGSVLDLDRWVVL